MPSGEPLRLHFWRRVPVAVSSSHTCGEPLRSLMYITLSRSFQRWKIVIRPSPVSCFTS